MSRTPASLLNAEEGETNAESDCSSATCFMLRMHHLEPESPMLHKKISFIGHEKGLKTLKEARCVMVRGHEG